MATSIIHCGFEYGAADSLGADTGVQGNELWGSWGTDVAVISTDSRTGTYCAEMDLSFTGYFGWDTADFGSGRSTMVVSQYVKISTNPTGDAVSVFRFLTGNGNLILRYNQSDDTYDWHATASSSTSSKSSVTCAVGEWHRIDVRVVMSANPWVVDWQVDGVDQTTFQPAQTSSTVTGLRWASGGDAGGSGVGRWDDIVVSATSGDYPLGEHKVVLLTPTSCSVSGTESNFNTFASNGTMSAWNATTALNAIDEVPPVTGANADGFAQVTTATNDYVQVEMSSYTLTSGESISGVRMLACGWAAGTASTIGFRSWNGTVPATIYTTADPTFTNAATPAWVCEMCLAADFNTQTELDNLAFRVGFSNDADPDIGIHAIYAEAAIQVPDTIFVNVNQVGGMQKVYP